MNKYILLCKSKILFSDQASVKYSLTSWKCRQTEHTYDTRGNVSSNPALKSNNNHFFAGTQLPFSSRSSLVHHELYRVFEESLLPKEFYFPVFVFLCCSVVQLTVERLCPRSCFSSLELQPSCQMWHQHINTSTLGLYTNSWQACWPIILLMNANGPSHSDTDTHARLNMHTHIWICLSTSLLYYFVAMMKYRSWRPLARSAPEVGLTPAVSHRRV